MDKLGLNPTLLINQLAAKRLDSEVKHLNEVLQELQKSDTDEATMEVVRDSIFRRIYSQQLKAQDKGG